MFYGDPLRETIRTLKEHGLRANFTHPEHAHLTLAFFEDISEQTATTILDTLETRIQAKAHSILISLGKLGAFPNQNKPSVVWLEIIDRSGDLIKLKHVIDETLESLKLCVEKRPFQAHLTVARIKDRRIFALSDATFAHEFDFARLPTVNLSQLTLFKSALTPKGSIYSVLGTISLT